MTRVLTALTVIGALAGGTAHAQADFEALLCEAAKDGRVVELVYDKDASKGCLPRLIDVHQVAVGNNGRMYMHGWQTRGCTKARDYASERIFRFDKMVQLFYRPEYLRIVFGLGAGHTNRSTVSNLVTSTSPISEIRSSGMTTRASNECCI